MSSSLLLFPQRFGWYVLQPSSGVCQTWELTRNLELRRIPVLLLACSQDWTCNLQMIVSLETILMLNWIIWNRTVWLNWIAWNRNVFVNYTVYLCWIELFEIQLFIYIKIDLTLNNLQKLICHKTQTNNRLWVNKWTFTICLKIVIRVFGIK